MKILLIAPYGIGNVILALPAMKRLRERFPHDRIDCLATLRSVHGILTRIPDYGFLDAVLFLSLGTWWRIVRTRYDVSVLLFPSAKIHYNALNFLCRARKRISSRFPDSTLAQGNFLNTVNVPVKVGLHDVHQNIRLLAPLGVKPGKTGRQISCLARKRKERIIGIHPGCKKKDDYKKWGNQGYLEIIRLILDRTDYRIRLFFGPDEKEDYGFFRRNLKGRKRIAYFVNRPIRPLFDRINECRVFLSNDTGLMHIANFLGVRNVVIAGPSDFRRTGPFNRPRHLVRAALKCIPCSHTHFISSYRFRCLYGDIRCMKRMSVKKVWKILETVL